MKIKIEIDENLTEDEIVIHCKSLNEDIFRFRRRSQMQLEADSRWR